MLIDDFENLLELWACVNDRLRDHLAIVWYCQRIYTWVLAIFVGGLVANLADLVDEVEVVDDFDAAL